MTLVPLRTISGVRSMTGTDANRRGKWRETSSLTDVTRYGKFRTRRMHIFLRRVRQIQRRKKDRASMHGKATERRPGE
jgi:hypothetical protein